MSQTLLNIDMLTNEALMKFDNALEMGSVADRQYEDYYQKSGAKIGDTLRVREPVRMAAASGRPLVVNNIQEKSRAITVADQRHVAWPFNSADMALTLDEYSSRYIDPATSELASIVDLQGHAAALAAVYNHVGTPGTDPNSALTWLQAKAKLNSYSVPKDGQLIALLNENAEISTVDALKGLFNKQATLDKQFDSGEMGSALGFDFRMTQNCPKFTTGTGTALGTLSATATSGSSLAITGATTSGTITVGMIITVAACYQFNLRTRTATGNLQQFIVTAAITLSGGAGTLTVSPEIITSGNYQNMSTAGAVSGSAVTLVSGSTSGGIYSRNWAMHNKAIALVSADMPIVSAKECSIKRGKNLSIRVIRTYDVQSDQEIFRMDILFGWAVMRPEWMVGVAGAA
ncbi:MAG TPA: P22 phage major capsid protein family protein [Mucilaginibacter sp.]